MTEATALTAIVLAAGQGTRMKSSRPKVLHPLCGAPMIHHVLDAAFAAGAQDVVVVVGFGRDEVEESVKKRYGDRVRLAIQEHQRGTGDAVRCALPAVSATAESVMILCGDTPLLDPKTLTLLRRAASESTLVAMLTTTVPDPSGLGRIVRDESGKVVSIVEEKDATPKEREIREINPAVYVIQTRFLRQAIERLSPNNAQNELYLTDAISMAAAVSDVVAVHASDYVALSGINDRAQLSAAEEVLYRTIADRWRRHGATIRASARIDASVLVEQDATIEHSAVLRGKTRIGQGALIDVGCVLNDVTVSARATLKPYTVATSSNIGEAAQIGPFSHLRQDSEIETEAHVGNFVETKKTIMRKGSKANHLAYLGDGDVGEGANVGAGTIFCNYDGFQKHRTEIGAGAFIGSDSQLVAPVRVGNGAYVATGTTVTKDIPDNALGIARIRQENKLDYAVKLKERLKAAMPKRGA